MQEDDDDDAGEAGLLLLREDLHLEDDRRIRPCADINRAGFRPTQAAVLCIIAPSSKRMRMFARETLRRCLDLVVVVEKRTSLVDRAMLLWLLLSLLSIRSGLFISFQCRRVVVGWDCGGVSVCREQNNEKQQERLFCLCSDVLAKIRASCNVVDGSLRLLIQ